MMLEPPPSTRRPGGGERRASSGDFGPASTRVAGPPSQPRGSRASFGAGDAQLERPARLQMLVALVLALVLVAIPLYLWRRPRAEPIAAPAAAAFAGELATISGAPAAPEATNALVLSEPRIVSCHDPGPKKTPPELCDRIAPLEAAFAGAIEASAGCVAADTSGGTIIFVADVQFERKTVAVATPPEGRTLKSAKVAGACARAVKAKLATLPFESLEHEHARYRVSITATYPSSAKR